MDFEDTLSVLGGIPGNDHAVPAPQGIAGVASSWSGGRWSTTQGCETGRMDITGWMAPPDARRWVLQSLSADHPGRRDTDSGHISSEHGPVVGGQASHPGSVVHGRRFALGPVIGGPVSDLGPVDGRRSELGLVTCENASVSVAGSAEQPSGFECPICFLRLFSQTLLTQHMRLHGAVMLFVCEVCCRPFPEKSSLSRHVMIHCGEPPFLCGVCGRSFSRKARLQSHLRLHDAYYCQACGDSFHSREQLNQHALIHADVPPLVCEVCGKGYLERKRLNEHAVRHTAKRPFACRVCGRMFAVKRYLVKHVTRVHALKTPSKDWGDG